MGSKLVETLMGAVVLFVVAAFLYFAYSNTSMQTADGIELTARFDRVDGLAIGGDVRMSGIKVGTIIDQYLDKETYQAVVRMSVDKEVKLPEDTFAKITSEGLLGGNYLVLDPGGSDVFLEDGDEIEETQGAVDLLGLIDKFGGDSDKD
ncbi:MAG: outer membrane lipid asymmetry maintenance protein MlaD [Kordiimonas sp.]|nr:outer membrane lipid asymmetry maintenance protein MlaD [Kordiimonas sp.]|tara:strand:+ start:669 stop:1115 length:447 start_codon:yes stop_codon:yes gene_type:complete